MHYIKVSDRLIQNPDFGFFSKLFSIIRSLLGVKRKPKTEIEYWYLEIDESGKVTREIALDKRRKVIEIAPFLQNRGQWTDSNVTLDSTEFEQISKFRFDLIWEEYIN